MIALVAVLKGALLLLHLYWWIIIASAIFSWLIAFGVVNQRNQVVHSIGAFLYQATEPALRPIRRFLPSLGAIDISPVILLIGLYVIEMLIRGYFPAVNY